jgi:DNA-binding transcriptional MerR regulator
MPIRRPPKNRDYFTVDEAAAVSGLASRNMVTYLERAGIFSSTYTTKTGIPWRRKGSWRCYTFRDIILLKVISRLLASGVQVGKLKKAMNHLRDAHPEIAYENRMAKYLVTDGENVFFRNESHQLETLGSGQYAFAFVLQFRALHQAAVSKLTPEQVAIDRRFRQRTTGLAA